MAFELRSKMYDAQARSSFNPSTISVDMTNICCVPSGRVVRSTGWAPLRNLPR
uniref:Uncharacterized protein n=1 Tax=Lotus japonicus TaxID=34305 RepID=I3SUL8_LOTJA|nr:unknown [Lotus japonicus]